MAIERALALPLALLLASWAMQAAALDRAGAVDAAKRQLNSKCTGMTPCTFDAKPEDGKWYVRVQFTKRNSIEERAVPYPGGHAILIFDQTGKLVGRVEGK
jgi:hypothetical protein